ncbi:MAG: RNA-binding S4 domain-containing protein [Candidatus Puniceispirillaceae bacterium]
MEQNLDSLRLDKWLWYARFLKTRSAASKMISSGKLRIDGALVNKPHRAVQIGHVYTFAQGPHIRVIKVLALATRRGPAPEAALLYEDMAPIEPRQKQDGASLSAGTFETRNSGAGRPTKRDRRKTEALKEWL